MSVIVYNMLQVFHGADKEMLAALNASCCLILLGTAHLHAT